MNTLAIEPAGRARWIRPVAVLVIIFGVMTVFSGGSVLFGPDTVQGLAGDYLPFVVWFNFLAGFLYVAAGIGLLLGRRWALGLALFIAAATALTALAFVYQVMQGASYEPRTVGALALRFSIWAAIAAALRWQRRPA